MTPLDLIKNARRIVIKIGSALITDISKGHVKEDWLASVALDIKSFKEQEIIIVSSGAIALGRASLGIGPHISTKDLKIEQKQAAAAVGQITLINAFQKTFINEGLNVAQILLNPDDTENRRTHLNARVTIETLLKHATIPVINENDTTATDEIRFGDNDKLAARVAQMVGADLLLILSTTDGVYTDNPMINPAAEHIPIIKEITDAMFHMAKESVSGISSGGMKSKIESASIAVKAGTNVIITSGAGLHPVNMLLDNKQRSTILLAEGTPHNARERWIAAHLKPKGTIIIDDGAAHALKSGKSILPVGVSKVTGTFERGDAVHIKTHTGEKIAIGLSAYNSKEADIIKGHQSCDLPALLGYSGRDVLIHRNDLVLLKNESV